MIDFDSSVLVFSTDKGRITPEKESPCVPQGDGIVRLKRETKGRKGKGVSTVNGLLVNNSELKKIAKELKKICGCGGAVKDGIIEIQGDQRNVIKVFLEKKGFEVKLAGG